MMEHMFTADLMKMILETLNSEQSGLSDLVVFEYWITVMNVERYVWSPKNQHPNCKLRKNSLAEDKVKVETRQLTLNTLDTT